MTDLESKDQDEATPVPAEPGEHGLTRGKALGAGALAVAGLALGGALEKAGGAAAATMTSSAGVPSGDLTLLPSSTAQAYFTNNLMSDAEFVPMYEQFVQKGFDFNPARVMLAIGISPSSGGAVGAPFALAIVPAVQHNAKISDPSHDVVSIVRLKQGLVSSVVASQVTVNHNPFQLAQFTLFEGSDEVTASRHDLQSMTPAALAAKLGAPQYPNDGTWAALDGPAGNDAALLSTTAYHILLGDKFAKKWYPAAAGKSLGKDASLLKKWSAVNEARYLQFLQNSGGGGAAGKASGSSSSSTYGCTSTSCSWGRKTDSAE